MAHSYIQAHDDELEAFRWGLIPAWAKEEKIGSRMINARAETLAEKPSFKNAYKHRRCLVPADGFYEWKKEGRVKIPYFVRLKSEKAFAFAGLWDVWKSKAGERIFSFTIVTTSPNPLLSEIHNRMPVILSPEAYDTWLDSEPVDRRELRHLLVAYPAEKMEAFVVSSRVNSPTNDDSETILPV